MLLKFLLPAFIVLSPLPAFAEEQIFLEVLSDEGTFIIEIIWTSADIGSENIFNIRFIEPETGKEVEDMVYDFGIAQDDRLLFMRTSQTSHSQKVTFDEVGSYTILVNDIDGLGEDASVSVQVTPEFQLAWTIPAAFAALFILRNRLAT